MFQPAHMGIFRIRFEARRTLDSDLSSACEEAAERLCQRGVKFVHCGVAGDSAFVEVESKKVPITMRVLREKGFDPSVGECVHRPTVTFPRLIRIVLAPRPGTTIEDEHGSALEDLTVAGLYPFGSTLGFGPEWGEGCATFDVEDFNLDATLKVMRDGGYEIAIDQ
jgi:hypothetical protein